MAGPPDLSDDDIRAHWRAAGGEFHGPNVEHGDMPESKLLPYLRSLLSRPGSVCVYQKAEPNETLYLTTCGKELWLEPGHEWHDFCAYCGGAIEEKT